MHTYYFIFHNTEFKLIITDLKSRARVSIQEKQFEHNNFW